VRVIELERLERGIARVTIDRPEARNAMTFAMWDRLRELARELGADRTVSAVIFTGSGDAAFISGTDIAEFRGFRAKDGVAYEKRMERVMRALERIPVPTIAAIAGACTGGGAAVAACCDVRIGAPNARIGVPIARTLGNCITIRNLERVAALVGLDAAKLLLLTGRLLDAGAAHRAGFLNEVADGTSGHNERALALALEFAGLAPWTLRATKEGARRLRDATPRLDDTDLVRACYGSADFAEGVDAFIAKRPARWTGR
jgi:enoyl-CoA hydratase